MKSDFMRVDEVVEELDVSRPYAYRVIRQLNNELKKLGCDAVYLGDFGNIKNYFEKNSNNNDMLITMGAGNIDTVGDELLS